MQTPRTIVPAGHILANGLGRGFGLGLASGAVLGATYGVMVIILMVVQELSRSIGNGRNALAEILGSIGLMFMAALIGGGVGLFFGGIAGIVNGFVWWAVTTAFFRPLRSSFEHRWITACVCMLTTAFLGMCVAASQREGLTGFWSGEVGPPTLIATLNAAWAAGRLSRWYDRASEEQNYRLGLTAVASK